MSSGFEHAEPVQFSLVARYLQKQVCLAFDGATTR